MKNDRKLQPSKKTGQKQPSRKSPAPPIMKRTVRSKGLFGSLGVFGKETPAGDKVRVFINGRAYYLGVDEMVGARVQYFLNGESRGIVDFSSPQHVRAAVTGVAGPNGYEIHVLRLAPYAGRPELVFTPRVRTVPPK